MSEKTELYAKIVVWTAIIATITYFAYGGIKSCQEYNISERKLIEEKHNYYAENIRVGKHFSDKYNDFVIVRSDENVTVYQRYWGEYVSVKRDTIVAIWTNR